MMSLFGSVCALPDSRTIVVSLKIWMQWRGGFLRGRGCWSPPKRHLQFTPPRNFCSEQNFENNRPDYIRGAICVSKNAATEIYVSEHISGRLFT